MSLKENKREFYFLTEDFITKYTKDIWNSQGGTGGAGGNDSEDGYAENDKELQFDGYYGWLESINEHWKQFEPPPPIVHSVLIVIYSVMLVFGCVGNALVIFLFFRSRSLRNPANYLVLNLAISDFLILGTNLPALIYNSVQQGPALGSIGCQAYGFLAGLCGTTTIMTLAGIAVDRYYVIVFPLTPFKRASKRSALSMIFGSWIYALTFSSLPLFGINEYVLEGILTSCSFDYLSNDIKSRIFIFVFFLAAWVIPLSIITFAYLKIYRTASKAGSLQFFQEAYAKAAIAKRATCTDMEMPRCFRIGKSINKVRTEIKIAKTTLMAVSIWVFAWTPYAILALIGIFVGPNKYLTPMASLIPSLICKSASCINPFVYALSHPKFQRELMSAVTKLGCFSSCNRASYYSASTMDSASFSPASILLLRKASNRISLKNKKSWNKKGMNDKLQNQKSNKTSSPMVHV